MASNTTASPNILSLPTEIQIEILSHLDFISQMRVERVCPKWSNILLSAPKLIAKRYTNISAGPYGHAVVSDTTSMHKLLNRDERSSHFNVHINIVKGEVDWWDLSVTTVQEDSLSKEVFSEDISQCPFLDEPVIKVVQEKLPVDLEKIKDTDEWNTWRGNLLTGKAAAVTSPTIFLLRPCPVSSPFPAGEELSWSITPEDFAPRNQDSKTQHTLQSRASTRLVSIRELMKMFTQKLKSQIDSGKLKLVISDINQPEKEKRPSSNKLDRQAVLDVRQDAIVDVLLYHGFIRGGEWEIVAGIVSYSNGSYEDILKPGGKQWMEF